jgi:hypothetical protein
MRPCLILLGALLAAGVTGQAQKPALVLQLKDYVAMPITGSPTGTGNSGLLARVNVMREEPGGAGRFFVVDLNGPLYILDKKTKAFTTYLDFNGRDAKTGLFDKLPTAMGYANGLICVQFDPDYVRNGKLYTIHLEELAAPGSSMPDGSSVPGLKLAGYTNTPAIKTPGTVERDAVVIEWTDTNIKNTTFEGTAREIMRVQLNTRIHPMGDLIFNPLARAGDPEWRVMYVGVGDGGSGEQKSEMRNNPQRLDTLVGKILRIIPDAQLHTSTSDISENGRYRIPRDNPFVAIEGARKEIWAYGFRNPHRFNWDVDPATKASVLFTANIGLHTWEDVYIVRKGANYGYSEREGNEKLEASNQTSAIPSPDEIPVRVNDTKTAGTVVPTYPVAQYGHTPDGGDGITGGFVYRGKAMPLLQGKYIFGDITTGRVWYAELKDLLAADDKNPATLAPLHEVHIRWDSPADKPDAGEQVYPTMFPVVLAAYKHRGGMDPDLPGTSTVSGPGRADIRFAVDAAGELYITSKSDGMIRTVVGATIK